MLPAKLARGAVVVRAAHCGVAWPKAAGAWSVLPIVPARAPHHRRDVACKAEELPAELRLPAPACVVRIARAAPLWANHEVHGRAAPALMARIADAMALERAALAAEMASSIGTHSLDRPRLERGRKVGGAKAL